MNEAIQVALIVALIPLLGTLLNLVNTWRLEQEVHRLNIGLDQRVQRLHRAHELVTGLNISTAHIIGFKSQGLALKVSYQSLLLNAEHSAKVAELLGLAHAIGDKKLLELVARGSRLIGESDEECDLTFTQQKENILELSAELHTRISQLLIEATRKK